MRFSIIIPVYNVERYIRRCLDSVMNQTYDDYEVIIIDDETPDNSMKIVQEFADRYPGKIRIFHQKNTRQGGARNRGVRMAQGEYILFVDSDDYVSPKLLETVNMRLSENPCDILAFRFWAVTPEGKQLFIGDHDGISTGVYYPERDKCIFSIRLAPWNKVYLRTFYLESGVQFPEKIRYEDAILRLLYVKARSISVCDDCLYYYVQSDNSTTRQKVSEHMLDILKMTDIICEEFRKNGLYEMHKDILEYSLIRGILYVIDGINASEPKNPLQKTLIDYIVTRFPDYESNPCIDQEYLKLLKYLRSHQFRQYHWKTVTLRRIKDRLLKSKLIASINAVRLSHK